MNSYRHWPVLSVWRHRGLQPETCLSPKQHRSRQPTSWCAPVDLRWTQSTV